MVSDIDALSTSLNWWEFWGYVSLAAVMLGCAGEAIHEFWTWSRRWTWWAEKGGKVSALILIAALAAELVTQVKTNSMSGQIIADLNLEAAGRRITKEQHDSIVHNLRTMPPETFFIEAMSESEAGLYASDIVKTLTDGGWIDGGHTFPMGEIWTGLVIFQTSASGSSPAKLAAAFQVANVPFSVGDSAHVKEKLTIMVGGKPPPF